MKRKLRKLFRLDKPEFASVSGWREWRENAQSEHPIKYFLVETVPDWFRSVFYHKLWTRCFVRPYWKVRHTFWPSNRYHMINTGLKPGYHDPSERIIHGVFTLAVEFLDNTVDAIDWNANPMHKRAYHELSTAVNWWKTHVINGESSFEVPDYNGFYERAGFMGILDDKYDDDPDGMVVRHLSRIAFKAEEEKERIEQEMLMLIMKNRQFLWYP